jgi:hypothetical protein|nr:hypothetical protein [Kofleriaceae bacterium]
MTRAIAVCTLIVAMACGHNDTNLTDGDGGAGGNGVDAGPKADCTDVGTTCTVNSDCCTDRCTDHTCLPADSCLAPEAACTAGATTTCCSGRCEPVEGQASVTRCADLCRGDGVACTAAIDCCNLDCNAGTCGGDECHVEGDSCANDAQCCSNICTDSKCQLDPANTTCRGIGETCNSGPQMGCCSMVCDTTQNPPRCDFGSNTCVALHGACDADAQCCNGATCDPATHECAIACTDTGGACAQNADCCSSICAGSACAALPDCTLVNGACTANADCCSGACVGGFCTQNVIL